MCHAREVEHGKEATSPLDRHLGCEIATALVVNPGVESKFNRQFNLCSDDGADGRADDCGMTTSDYLINAVFVLVVLRQARDRRVDFRSLIAPLLAIVYVAHMYVHFVPTAGNDLVLVGALAALGLTLGIASGLATQVRAGADGVALARVGWIAGVLLMLGICGRMVFVFVVTHGAEPALRSFSVAQHIGAAAWPVALVLMAVWEVVTRLMIIQVRGRRLAQRPVALALGACA